MQAEFYVHRFLAFPVSLCSNVPLLRYFSFWYPKYTDNPKLYLSVTIVRIPSKALRSRYLGWRLQLSAI